MCIALNRTGPHPYVPDLLAPAQWRPDAAWRPQHRVAGRRRSRNALTAASCRRAAPGVDACASRRTITLQSNRQTASGVESVPPPPQAPFPVACGPWRDRGTTRRCRSSAQHALPTVTKPIPSLYSRLLALHRPVCAPCAHLGGQTQPSRRPAAPATGDRASRSPPAGAAHCRFFCLLLLLPVFSCLHLDT